MNREQIQFPPQHAALRDDVHLLGGMVGEIVREQGGDALFALVEGDRRTAIRRRGGDSNAAVDLAVRVKARPPTEARDLVRAFSLWFQAVNLAEKVHRIRRRREYFLADTTRPQPGGVQAAFEKLKRAGLDFDAVLALLRRLRIEPVFAAHPTESTRRTVLRRQLRVAQLLFDRIDPTLTPPEEHTLCEQIRSELTTAWQTEEYPRERLMVADEREHVLFYLVEVLYRIVPGFYEEIATAMQRTFAREVDALDLPSILSFGTWVGGDMDGNPDVNAKTIRETLARQKRVVINAYFGECQALAEKLSQSAGRVGVSADLAQRLDEYSRLFPAARSAVPARHDRMPYRAWFLQVAERLRRTYDGASNAYESADQFRIDINLAAASLKDNRGTHAGYFAVSRLLRRIDTFGFHLATLDVRQHSDVHHAVLANGLALSDWQSSPTARRHDYLVDAIERDLGPRVELSALGRRTLAVFDAMLMARKQYGEAAVGYYIVSGARHADDVLAPLLLARWAEAYDRGSGQVPIDIAPLFESIDSLEGCGETIGILLADRVYRAHLAARDRTQCALVGYSDSNKEAGICASRFAVLRAQQTLASRLHMAQDELVVFHARGGSIARGGDRIDELVRSVPTEAVGGVLRFTEQGEIVNQNYGLRPIALRTMERAFHSLAESLAGRETAAAANAEAKRQEMAQHLARTSAVFYRGQVHANKDFQAFFEQATPIDVIERMQIGSRLARREQVAGLAGLRAVPWVFAWSQPRYMLPGWFAAGTGLKALLEATGIERLRETYASWPFFHNMVDDVEIMLARADLAIAEQYLPLVSKTLRSQHEIIKREFDLARLMILQIKDCAELLDSDQTQQRAVQLRNPYVDPMNLMQVDLLQRWRESDRQDRDLFAALLASISGIAQGLQTTG
ncbi:MAG: phosphoenolpyruvate carboxylase [Steroidobacteraceae bacterium]